MTLSGLRLIVTGAAAGIGAATVDVASRMGAHVVGLDRDPFTDDAAGISADGVHCAFIDVSDEQSVATAFDESLAILGGLDAVIHCAGIMRAQRLSITDVDLAVWNQVMHVNLTGTFLVAREAARIMVPQRRGIILLVASRAGILEASGSIAYGASKGGVHGLGISLAKALEPSCIRVHVVMPGNVDTPLMAGSLVEALQNGADPDLVAQMRENLARPNDVARALALLVSPDADTLTGTVMTV